MQSQEYYMKPTGDR